MSDSAKFVLSSLLAVALTAWSILSQRTEVVVPWFLIAVWPVLMVGLVAWLWWEGRKFRRQLGIVRVHESRRAAVDVEYKAMQTARRRVECFGIMHRSLWNDREQLESAMRSLVGRDAEVVFYLCDPESAELRRRAEIERDVAADWPEQVRLQIRRFEELARAYPALRLKVYTYHQHPVWHVVINDHRALLGWYPTGHSGYEAPLYEMRTDVDSSFYAAVSLWMDSVRAGAKQVVGAA